MKKMLSLLILSMFFIGAIPANAMNYGPNQMPMMQQNGYVSYMQMQNYNQPPRMTTNNRPPQPPKRQNIHKNNTTAKIIGGTLIGAVAGGVLTSYLVNK